MDQKGAVVQIFVVALAVVMGGYNLGRSLMGPRQGTDFASSYTSSRAWLDGETALIYSRTEAFQVYADRIGVRRPVDNIGSPVDHQYPGYPPAVVLLLAPLAMLPYTTARLAWYGVNLIATIGALWLLFRDRPSTERRHLYIASAVTTSLLFPVYSSLYMGQINSVLLFLMVGALHMARRGRPWGAGALVGLAGLIKIFPFVLALWFLVTRRYQAAVATAVASAAMVAASLLVLDWRVQSDFLFLTLPAQSLSLHIEQSQGLFGVFTRLLGSGEIVASVAYMPNLAMGLATFCALGCLVATGRAVWRHGRRDRLADDIGFALFLVMAVLVSPKSWDHYAIFLLPAYVLFLEAVTVRPIAHARRLTFVVAISFCIWSSVMTTSAVVAQIPTGVIFQPLWSIKCLSMLALWASLVRVMKILRIEDGGLRI